MLVLSIEYRDSRCESNDHYEYIIYYYSFYTIRSKKKKKKQIIIRVTQDNSDQTVA